MNASAPSAFALCANGIVYGHACLGEAGFAGMADGTTKATQKQILRFAQEDNRILGRDLLRLILVVILRGG
jgi:hypothetical protein